jgi:hypothetical protein
MRDGAEGRYCIGCKSNLVVCKHCNDGHSTQIISVAKKHVEICEHCLMPISDFQPKQIVTRRAGF